MLPRLALLALWALAALVSAVDPARADLAAIPYRGQLSHNYLNSLVQSTETALDLRSFAGTTVPASDSGNTGTVVQTLGLNTVGDGRGGTYYWNSASTAADNGASVIKPAAVSGAGRWLLLSNPPALGADQTWLGINTYSGTLNVTGIFDFNTAAGTSLTLGGAALASGSTIIGQFAGNGGWTDVIGSSGTVFGGSSTNPFYAPFQGGSINPLISAVGNFTNNTPGVLNSAVAGTSYTQGTAGSAGLNGNCIGIGAGGTCWAANLMAVYDGVNSLAFGSEIDVHVALATAGGLAIPLILECEDVNASVDTKCNELLLLQYVGNHTAGMSPPSNGVVFNTTTATPVIASTGTLIGLFGDPLRGSYGIDLRALTGCIGVLASFDFNLDCSGNVAATSALIGGGTLSGNALAVTGPALFNGAANFAGGWKIAGTAVTSTAAQLNYLNAATGTTGTASTNLVFSTSPSIASPTVTGSFTATGLVTNADLANSTISGIALGGSLGTLTFGTHLAAGGASYNGSAGVTISTDATTSATASTIVARDASGNINAAQYNINGASALSQGTTYVVVYDPAGSQIFTGGNTLDPTDYFSNTTITFRSRNYATTFATITSSGLNLGTGETYGIGSSTGQTKTCTVNQALTLIFTGGIITGGTCNS